PKASPGSCQVLRPEGAGTTNFISLQGECNGEIPQYVAQFNGGGTVTLPISNIIPTGAQQRTAVIWFKDAAPLASRDALSLSINNGCITNGGAYFEINVGQYSDAAELNAWCTNEPFPINIVQNGWYFIAYEYNGTAQIGYLSNGTKLSRISGIYTYNSPAANIIIGYGDDGPPNYWLGEIANVQIYNTALSSNNIKALYQEGIGGAPISIQSLAGWWPLNGNANDYSGNNNNGVPTGVTYTTNWYSGYSAP
ncbi:LamG domain protein jellyroll fold domain protein, partial [mine drainage metagenome]